MYKSLTFMLDSKMIFTIIDCMAFSKWYMKLPDFYS